MLEQPTADAVVEAVTRRYYKIRDLDDVTTDVVDGRHVVRSRYVHGRPVEVLADGGPLDEVPALLAAAADAAQSLGDGAPPRSTSTPRRAFEDVPDTDALAASLAATLAAADLPVTIGRVAFVVVGHGRQTERRDGDLPPARTGRRAAVLDGRIDRRPSSSRRTSSSAACTR